MSNYLFIVNPVSGKGSGKKAIPAITNYCKNYKVDYLIEETKYPLHAKELVKKEISNFQTIIAVGGDGTINEVINGIPSGAAVVMGVLPVGSGNDFVKNLGSKGTMEDSLSVILDKNKHEIVEVDIGNIEFTEKDNPKIKRHSFINNLGIGFDAYVGYLNQTNKVFSGVMSYIYAVIKALFNYKMINIDFSFNENNIVGERLMVSIGNGLCSGGGFYLNPNANISDGLLNISVFDKITRRRILTALPIALLNKLEKIPEAKMYTADYMEIKLKYPYYVHCDGEIISKEVNSIIVRVDKKAIKVIRKLGG